MLGWPFLMKPYYGSSQRAQSVEYSHPPPPSSPSPLGFWDAPGRRIVAIISSGARSAWVRLDTLVRENNEQWQPVPIASNALLLVVAAGSFAAETQLHHYPASSEAVRLSVYVPGILKWQQV